MKMAKASQEEMDRAMKLVQLLEATIDTRPFDRPQFPGAEDEEGTYFDEENHDDLKKLVAQIRELCPGGGPESCSNARHATRCRCGASTKAMGGASTEIRSMKYLRVTMPDGSKWDVPAHIIAENRAKYYADDKNDPNDPVYREELAYTLENDDEIEDWSSNNMNWEDVQAHAVRADVEAETPDYQEGWVNGEKEVVEHQPKETL